MQALSITNPWASLIALGVKRFETRDWPAPILPGSDLAIHASARFPDDARDNLMLEPFRSVLYEAYRLGWYHEGLPCGAVIAVAKFQRCIPTASPAMRFEYAHMTDEEFAFGNFQPGRFAWELTNVRPILPLAVSGALGIWTWAPPAAGWTEVWQTKVRLPVAPAPEGVSLTALYAQSHAQRMREAATEKGRYELLVDGQPHEHAWTAPLLNGFQRCTKRRCPAMRRQRAS